MQMRRELQPLRSIECDVLEGLEEIAIYEINARLRPPGRVERPRAGALRFGWRGDLRVLLELRSVAAAYLVLSFAVPRPKALLGHQHFTALASAAGEVLDLHGPGSFKTLRIGAAGEDSAVLTRLKAELAAQLGLAPAGEEGDLLMRLRRAGAGWEALVRISPRPLSTRPWRVCNFPGAPNAALAHAVAVLTDPGPDDVVLNIGCGSGTLLIERLLLGPAAGALGCDTDPQALDCARANLNAAGLAGQIRLARWDATQLPLEDGSVNVIVGDLPYGQLIGTHAENERLYPRLLAEVGRLAEPGARMALLTHELRLLDQAAARHRQLWTLQRVVRVRSGGMTPGIFVFERL
jgi:tRNA (guanine6-N2)-methyltransferase